MTGTTVENTLSAIDDAIGPAPAASSPSSSTSGQCHRCERPIDGALSEFFCSESCQHIWHSEQADLDLTDRGPGPREDIPETAPQVPLESWLGAPPPGAIARDGHEVLDAVTAFLRRFVAFPNEHCAPVVALWFAHTHIVDRVYVTPRLILSSAEPGSGKTRVLEVGQFLVRKPEMTINITTAAIFRLLLDEPVTLLFDEIDTVFTGGGGNNEDLRGLLNSGYKRTATVARCVGDAKAMQVQRFPVFAPVALAGIAGGMPNTLTTRAVTIHMRKCRNDEEVEEFIEEDVEREAVPLREELAAWTTRAADKVANARPDRPAGVRNRAAEIWRVLLALADTAGGHWPETARKACTHFVVDAAPKDADSFGVQLLADLRSVFTNADTNRLPTSEILSALTALEESPWADLDGRGRQLDARRMSKELARFQVSPVTFKDATNIARKGYVTYEHADQVGLADAWARYLPTSP